MNLNWRLFANAQSEDAAIKLAARHFEKAGIPVNQVSVAPYHKGGVKIDASTTHSAESWPEFVIIALSLAQCTGYGWTLHGSIANELDAWSNSSTVSGITCVHVWAAKSA